APPPPACRLLIFPPTPLPVDGNICNKKVSSNFPSIIAKFGVSGQLLQLLSFTREHQYKKPNNHNGILVLKPDSISSATIKRQVSLGTCLVDLFFPPTSMVISLTRKSPLRGSNTSNPAFSNCPKRKVSLRFPLSGILRMALVKFVFSRKILSGF